MRHGACKAQGDGRTEQEAPGLGVGNLVAKLKRQISHTKFTAHQIPPSAPPRGSRGTPAGYQGLWKCSPVPAFLKAGYACFAPPPPPPDRQLWPAVGGAGQLSSMKRHPPSVTHVGRQLFGRCTPRRRGPHRTGWPRRWL